MSEHAFLSVICRDDTKYVCCPLDRDVNWRESQPLCWLKIHIYKVIPEHQYVVVPTYVSFAEKTAFIKKKKKKKKIPTCPP